MKRISCNPRFVNEAGDDLVPGKIHTIRSSYSFWKKFEGRDVELFTWEGKPYRSKQKVFCVKRLVSVERLEKIKERFLVPKGICDLVYAGDEKLARNDGFKDEDELMRWFADYPDGEMAILHFTDFRYGA
jgi:hypothetical protein